MFHFPYCTYVRTIHNLHAYSCLCCNLHQIQHKADLRTQSHSTLIRFQNTFLIHKLITTFVKLISVSPEVPDSTVVIMTSPVLPFQSLDENPRQHFAEFERQVFDDAGSACTDIFPNGLLSLVVSDSIWATLPNNAAIVDGATIIVARNLLLPPIQPADNATTGVWKAFESRRKIFDLYNAASLLLLKRLKTSLPTSDRQLLSHPVLGLANIQHLEIMDHLRTQYGIFRATDFQNLYIELEAKMPTGADFSEFASRFRLIFAQFAINNQSISQLQQCTFLARAIAPFPHLVKAQDTYFQRVPDPSARTFADLVSHIAIHAPNFHSTAADFGYVAATNIVQPSSETIQEFLKSSQFATIIATAAAAIKTGRPNRSKKSPKSVLTSSPRKYCHFHGYDWHDSVECRFMAKDTTLYSDAARNSKNHTSPPGGSTDKL